MFKKLTIVALMAFANANMVAETAKPEEKSTKSEEKSNISDNKESLSIDSGLISAIETLNIDEVKQFIAGRAFNSEAEKQQISTLIENTRGSIKKCSPMDFIEQHRYIFTALNLLPTFFAERYYVEKEYRALSYAAMSHQDNYDNSVGATSSQALKNWRIAIKALDAYNGRSWWDRTGKKTAIALGVHLSCLAVLVYGPIFLYELKVIIPKLKKLEEINELITQIPVSELIQ